MTSLYQNQSIQPFQDGFTLVELIVVILLTGILSISIAPRFFAVASYESRKASDEFLSALRYTQQMAMNRGGDIQLVLTATNFTVQRLGGGDLRSPDGLIPYTKPFPANVAISGTPLPATINYDRLGQPNAGYLINIGTQQIQIEEVTGYAHRL